MGCHITYNAVDVERFAGLSVWGLNPTKVFTEMLSHCHGLKCLLFSTMNWRAGYVLMPRFLRIAKNDDMFQPYQLQPLR